MKPLYPYKTLFGDLQVVLSDLQVDGERPGGGDRIVAASRVVNLVKLGREDWLTAFFDVTATAPIDEISQLEADGPLDMTAVVHCAMTNVRFSFDLARSGAEPGKWHRTVELPRAAFAGSAVVRCILVGTAGGRPDRWLGEADPWKIHFDEPPVIDFEGTMRVEWVSFATSQLAELRAFQKEAFYADFDPAKPTLYLNKDFDGLSALLADKRRAGPELAIHETTRMAFATDVWCGLFNASLASVIGRQDEDDDDEPAWPEVGWQENVLRSLLVQMYPVQSPEEGLRELREAWRAQNGGQIQSQLLGAIQAQVGTRNLIARSIRAVNLNRQEREES